MGDNKTIEGVELKQSEPINDVIIWKPTKPISNAQHRIIGEMLRREEEATGIKIMLVPFLINAEQLSKTTKKKTSAAKEE